MKDDYDNAKKMRAVELKEHYDKLQDKPFSQRAKLTYFFNTSRSVIGEDVPLVARAKSEFKYNLYEHERAWRPSMPPRSGA